MGATNLLADPMFVDIENNNFNIQYNSPCIDAGDPNSEFDADNSIEDWKYSSPFHALNMYYPLKNIFKGYKKTEELLPKLTRGRLKILPQGQNYHWGYDGDLEEVMRKGELNGKKAEKESLKVQESIKDDLSSGDLEKMKKAWKK